MNLLVHVLGRVCSRVQRKLIKEGCLSRQSSCESAELIIYFTVQVFRSVLGTYLIACLIHQVTRVCMSLILGRVMWVERNFFFFLLWFPPHLFLFLLIK